MDRILGYRVLNFDPYKVCFAKCVSRTRRSSAGRWNTCCGLSDAKSIIGVLLGLAFILSFTRTSSAAPMYSNDISEMEVLPEALQRTSDNLTELLTNTTEDYQEIPPVAERSPSVSRSIKSLAEEMGIPCRNCTSAGSGYSDAGFIAHFKKTIMKNTADSLRDLANSTMGTFPLLSAFKYPPITRRLNLQGMSELDALKAQYKMFVYHSAHMFILHAYHKNLTKEPCEAERINTHHETLTYNFLHLFHDLKTYAWYIQTLTGTLNLQADFQSLTDEALAGFNSTLEINCSQLPIKEYKVLISIKDLAQTASDFLA